MLRLSRPAWIARKSKRDAEPLALGLAMAEQLDSSHGHRGARVGGRAEMVLAGAAEAWRARLPLPSAVARAD